MADIPLTHHEIQQRIARLFALYRDASQWDKLYPYWCQVAEQIDDWVGQQASACYAQNLLWAVPVKGPVHYVSRMAILVAYLCQLLKLPPAYRQTLIGVALASYLDSEAVLTPWLSGQTLDAEQQQYLQQSPLRQTQFSKSHGRASEHWLYTIRYWRDAKRQQFDLHIGIQVLALAQQILWFFWPQKGQQPSGQRFALWLRQRFAESTNTTRTRLLALVYQYWPEWQPGTLLQLAEGQLALLGKRTGAELLVYCLPGKQVAADGQWQATNLDQVKKMVAGCRVADANAIDAIFSTQLWQAVSTADLAVWQAELVVHDLTVLPSYHGAEHWSKRQFLHAFNEDNGAATAVLQHASALNRAKITVFEVEHALAYLGLARAGSVVQSYQLRRQLLGFNELLCVKQALQRVELLCFCLGQVPFATPYLVEQWQHAMLTILSAQLHGSHRFPLSLDGVPTAAHHDWQSLFPFIYFPQRLQNEPLIHVLVKNYDTEPPKTLLECCWFAAQSLVLASLLPANQGQLLQQAQQRLTQAGWPEQTMANLWQRLVESQQSLCFSN